jgi:molecular chaperone GrpE (heat shock protein)
MHDPQNLKVTKWPFFLGDAFMLGLAYFIYWQSPQPLAHWEFIAGAVCVVLGALLGVLPFMLDYRMLLKRIEASAVGTVTEKIQNLETVARQITSATNHWQSAQESADKTAATAKEMSERMATEARDFTVFMQKINDGEKATLRLEVEKLRRSEGEWMQVLVHVLDHIYALYHAAERSGQAGIITQLNQFQNACRDVARRVGLTPFAAAVNEPFDAERHRWADGEAAPAPGACVIETLAPGYTYQGKLLRPALVRVQTDTAPVEPVAVEPPVATETGQLL